jgi:cell shape-determining protein MreC
MNRTELLLMRQINALNQKIIELEKENKTLKTLLGEIVNECSKNTFTEEIDAKTSK